MGKWYFDKGPDSDVVLSSRVRLARNLVDYPFPHRSTPGLRREVMKLVMDALKNQMPQADLAGVGQEFRFVDFNDLSEIERYVLVEKHLVSKELAESNFDCGVLISADENISIMLNEEDHLRMQCLGAGMQIDKLYELINRVDDFLSSELEFAFDSKIGFLTCCPTNIGTAIRASAMLHLPALSMTGYIRGILESVGKLGVAVRGMFGENTETSGNIYQISNQVTLGRSEEEIIAGIQSLTNQLVEQERGLRDELLNQHGVRLEDRIMRSFGILTNTRIISVEETLQRLSDVRLGLNLGLIEGLDEVRLNELVLMIQQANIQQQAGKMLKPDDRDILRAELVRSVLKL